VLNVALLHKIVNSIATYFDEIYLEWYMDKQNWVTGAVIGLWVLALAYCGAAHGDTPAERVRELVEQDRRAALQALLAQNPELRALIEQIKRQVK
jgi:hypothetical protein